MAMEIKQVTDPAFGAYGKIITGYDCGELLAAMEQTPVPEDTIYVASDAGMEKLPVCRLIEKNLYGQLPIQVGYCNGHNKKMNAMEYHRTSEINVASTDLVLILGRQQDVEADDTYDTAKAEAFFVPAGTVIEVYATTLHYAPCHMQDGGFRCVVILRKGTNTDMEPVENVFSEDRLLVAKNKWLIGHEEGALPEYAFIGLRGENRCI